MMKRTFWISVAVVAVFALSLNAIAQPQGGPRQGGQVPGQMGQSTPQALLRNPEVVKMLNLTESQTTGLADVLRPGQRGNGGAAGGPGTRPTPGTQMTAEERAALAVQTQQRTTEMWAGINRILNAEQQTKFKEIYFQANNGMNSTQLNVWLLDVVALTAPQKEAIAKLVTDRAAEARAPLGQGASADERAAQRTAMQERNTKFVADINAILTAEQKAKATKLTEGAAALRTTLGIPATPAPGARGQGRPG